MTCRSNLETIVNAENVLGFGKGALRPSPESLISNLSKLLRLPTPSTPPHPFWDADNAENKGS